MLFYCLCFISSQQVIKSEQDQNTEKERQLQIEKEKQKQREEDEELWAMLFGPKGKFISVVEINGRLSIVLQSCLPSLDTT